jgi:hypothetical protein
VPLVVGTVLFCSIIKYIELSHGIDIGLHGFQRVEPLGNGFFEFFPRNLLRVKQVTWSHLWFLAYLFLYSVLLLPLLVRVARCVPRTAKPTALTVYLPPIPMALLVVATNGYWPFLPNLVTDVEWRPRPARLVSLLRRVGYGLPSASHRFCCRRHSPMPQQSNENPRAPSVEPPSDFRSDSKHDEFLDCVAYMRRRSSVAMEDDEILHGRVVAASGKSVAFDRASPLMDKELLQAAIDAMRDEQWDFPGWDARRRAQWVVDYPGHGAQWVWICYCEAHREKYGGPFRPDVDPTWQRSVRGRRRGSTRPGKPRRSPAALFRPAHE